MLLAGTSWRRCWQRISRVWWLLTFQDTSSWETVIRTDLPLVSINQSQLITDQSELILANHNSASTNHSLALTNHKYLRIIIHISKLTNHTSASTNQSLFLTNHFIVVTNRSLTLTNLILILTNHIFCCRSCNSLVCGSSRSEESSLGNQR